ncbi:hypothetical protein S40285_08743 [Stachybotrys chlorohalonatus IBT 40285]|uniref:Peptidase A1 domain-containing protein n=1 Tax=Stachybotrys chlorohalonatus (strain IBT 40285) TaxID=1283841 RepID=A0A084QUF9_STAC4|nr:hypothetical protein S40285_08743 [Stachybotrys chlorohalonata IBT 40285]
MAIFGLIEPFLLAILFPIVYADPEPRSLTWSETPVGPDGPWNAVEVVVGAPRETMALFPGATWQTWVITSDYCALNSSISHCGAGTYSKDAAIESDLNGIQFQASPQDMVHGVEVGGATTRMFMDTFDFQFQDGIVLNTSMSLIETQMLAYPSGDWYPMFAGCLSLGGPNINQSYEGINASIAPWYLATQDVTPSSSFSMHIGSAVPGASLGGSLLFGGYDRNRVVGGVLDYDGVFTEEITLSNLAIEVIQGESPFEFTSQSDLLSTGSGTGVHLDPCSPYLTLPRSTCDNIANYLPLNYSSSLGLYLWDTSDNRYEAIVHSASALAFTFQNGGSDVTINVPFQHLNLTLATPLVEEPTPYFPCHTGGDGTYVLGRAFLQDAFIGGNWGTERWWLAQAPGPSVGTRSHIASIAASDQSIVGSDSDWTSSWDSLWTDLAELSRTEPEDDTQENPPAEDPPANDPPTDNETEVPAEETTALSTGTIAGIAVGAGLGVLLLGIAGFLLWRRLRRAQGAAANVQTLHYNPPIQPYHGHVQQTPAEVWGWEPKHNHPPSEIMGQEQRPRDRMYEMP